MLGDLGARALEVLRAREAGFLPGSGGWEDQALWGVRVLRVLALERSRIADAQANAEEEFARAVADAQRALSREGSDDG